MKTHFLNLGFFQNLEVNNDPGTLSFVPVPLLNYVNFGGLGKGWQLSASTAGVFNRVELLYRKRGWGVFGGSSALFHFHGDRPKIDGDDFEGIYNFRGHRFQGEAGAIYFFRVQEREYQARASFEVVGHYFYELPSATAYVDPSDFIEYGPSLKVSNTRKSYDELKLFGFYPSISLQPQWRARNREWGLIGDLRRVEFGFKSEAQIDFAYSLSNRVAFAWDSNALWITKADRLSAASNGSLSRDPNAFFLGQVRSDRSAKIEPGLRLYLVKQKRLALKPFVLGAWYREIAIDDYRNRQVIGGGAKLLASAYKDRLIFSLGYGAAANVIEDKTLHEIRSFLSYRFL